MVKTNNNYNIMLPSAVPGGLDILFRSFPDHHFLPAKHASKAPCIDQLLTYWKESYDTKANMRGKKKEASAPLLHARVKPPFIYSWSLFAHLGCPLVLVDVHFFFKKILLRFKLQKVSHSAISSGVLNIDTLNG
jgi:hypothetical protein